MKKRYKGIIIALFSAIAISLHFNNCSQYSDGGMNGPSSLCFDCNTLPSTPSLKISNTYLDVDCGYDHLQLGGVCNPGDNSKNQIDYIIKRGGTTLDTRTGEGICENGRFYLVVRKPLDPDASGLCNSYPDCRIPYQISARLMVSSSDVAPLTQASAYNVNLTFQNGCN